METCLLTWLSLARRWLFVATVFSVNVCYKKWAVLWWWSDPCWWRVGQTSLVEKVEKALAENPDAVAVSICAAAETSTGALSDVSSDFRSRSRQFDALSIVDAVTSLVVCHCWLMNGNSMLVYSGQKCSSCVPGLSPVTSLNVRLRRWRRAKYRYKAGS